MFKKKNNQRKWQLFCITLVSVVHCCVARSSNNKFILNTNTAMSLHWYSGQANLSWVGGTFRGGGGPQ